MRGFWTNGWAVLPKEKGGLAAPDAYSGRILTISLAGFKLPFSLVLTAHRIATRQSHCAGHANVGRV